MDAPQRQPTSICLFTIALWVGAAWLVIVSPSPPAGLTWQSVLLFCALAAFAEYWEVILSTHTKMSLSFTVHLSAGILFGPLAAAAVAATGILITDGLVRRSGPLFVAFNVAQMAIATMLASMTYYVLGGGPVVDLLGDVPAVAAASLVYLLVNNTLVSVVVALTGRPFMSEWLESSRDVLLPYVSMGPLGALVAFAYVSTPWAIVYFIPLVLVIYNGFRLYVSLQHETDHALVALADSIDKRDQYTYQHSQRVARLSAEICESMALPPREVDLVVAAARVHDLGKIATDNRVLFKNSSLTPEEWRTIEQHPVEGGELAGRFSMFRQGRQFIRHHHERWDGKGYPDKLAGDDIPLGARIIAVADSYDAMTSDRPYRKGLPHHVALIELERGAGSQFDPTVVAAFLEREKARAFEPVPVTTELTETCSY